MTIDQHLDRPVWFHGDVATGNLLLRDGRLAWTLLVGNPDEGDAEAAAGNRA